MTPADIARVGKALVGRPVDSEEAYQFFGELRAALAHGTAYRLDDVLMRRVEVALRAVHAAGIAEGEERARRRFMQGRLDSIGAEDFGR